MTKLDLQTTEYKELFESYDDSIKDKLKCKDRSYDGAKAHSKDLADLLEFNTSFNDEKIGYLITKIYLNQMIILLKY